MSWTGRITLLTLLALIGAGVWYFFGQGVAVVMQAAKRGSAAEIVYGTGTVEPIEWAKVIAPVRARIEFHCRCEGKAVKKGDVLARLDEKGPRAELAQLEARKNFLSAEIARQTDLVARGMTSRQTFERAQSDLAQAEAQIAAANARLGDYTMTAPIDGVVLRADGQMGEIAGTVEPLFWVGKPHPLHIVADVNEEDIARVVDGQEVMLRNDAFQDRTLPAKVASVTPKGDPAKKTFRIYLSLPDDTPLRVGMSVEANVITSAKKDALTVPAEALTGNAVFVLENGRAVRREIIVGIRGTRAVEIVQGLTDGQRVIAPIPKGLKDGDRIRVIEKSPS